MSAPLPSPPSLPAWLERRPTKRSECPPPDQQCPWVSCRYHLAFDLKKKRHYGPNTHTPQAPARLILSLPEDPADWPAEAATCSLHVADGGGHTLDEIGALMGDISRERVRQLEQSALAKLAKLGIVLDLAEDMHLDAETRSPNYQRPSAETKGHRPETPRARSTDADLDGTYVGGFRPQDMTAKMRKIQAECAAPVKNVTLPPEEIARIEASIRAKQPAPRANATCARVTADTFAVQTRDPRSAARYARSRESLRSFRRLEANDASPAKAPPTTTPRPPSPPSTASLEIPPTIQAGATPPAPTTIQSDDQPEVAVAAALPEPIPSPPSIPQQPMTRPDMRTRRSVYEDANETAKRNLAMIMAARGLTRDKLSALARDAHTAHTPMSVDQAIVRAMNGTASPVSVWYRRLATILNIHLSDLCSDPAWLAAVAPEDSPVASPHSHLHRPPAPPETPPPSPQHSPSTPPEPPLPTHEDALAPLILAALDKAQALDRRVGELTAVAKVQRAEIDDLQQQLAAATKERDAATATLARIKAQLC